MDLFTGGFSSEVEDILLLNKRSKWVGGVVTKFFFFSLSRLLGKNA